MSHPRVFGAVTLLLAPCLGGCPVPIPHTETTSGAAVGVYRHSDDTPVGGAPVAVTSDSRDSTCVRAIARTTTDSVGGFRLPATQRRYGVFWVVPNLDRFVLYRLCLPVADTVRIVYEGAGSTSKEAPPLDSIDCVQWTWNGRSRASCNGRFTTPWRSGGRWGAGTNSGFYRVFLTNEDTRISKHVFLRPHVCLQWVQETGSRPPLRVREMLELPVDGKVTDLGHARLRQAGEGWSLELAGSKQGFLHTTAHLVFELGPPGQVHKVSGP